MVKVTRQTYKPTVQFNKNCSLLKRILQVKKQSLKSEVINDNRQLKSLYSAIKNLEWSSIGVTLTIIERI